MRRWTDGKSWSASRVSGSFLTYREMEGKRGGNGFPAARATRDAHKGNEHESADDGVEGYRYKPDGLMKQSFSITTSTGQHLHLISYFARSSAVSQSLQQPSNDPGLRHIRPEKGMYPESTVHEQNSIPAVTRGPMTSPSFAVSPQQPASAGASSSYGRPPTHPAHYPMGYGPGWAPPSPMHTPPPYSPYFHHAAHSSHPTSMAHSPHPSVGHSPHPSMGQSPLQHMHHPYPPHSQGYPPALTSFDRAPAPLSNSTTLPPPPPPPPHSHHIPPIQHGQQHRPSYALPSVARPPSSGAIDPSLAAMSYRPESTATSASSNGHTSTSSPLPPPPPPQQQQPAKNATTIPSISSLINETSGPTPPVRYSSHSPTAPPPPCQPQDIPSHKMSYDPARDVQALRHLDKATLRS